VLATETFIHRLALVLHPTGSRQRSHRLLTKPQARLLAALVTVFLEDVLRTSSVLHPAMDCSETPLFWGRVRKHSLTHSVAYTDGSALQTSPRAEFSIVFSDHASQGIARTFRSRVPGEQSISRAEAFAVLGALLLTKPNVHLTIYCDRLSLVPPCLIRSIGSSTPPLSIHLHIASLVAR
jgi:hypothetical protein